MTPRTPRSATGGDLATPRVAIDNADLATVRERLESAPWREVVGRVDRLAPGALTAQPVRIPQAEAQRILRDVARLVVDLPRTATSVVVWEDDGAELAVDVAATTLTCKVGLLSVGVAVWCDQLPERTRVEVPLAVGTEGAPAGLVMSSLTRLDGPGVVVDRWSEAITAYAWEAVLESARRLCELLGADASGHGLVPGAIASESGTLVIQPMARIAGGSR